MNNKEKIIKLRNEGKTIPEICEILNVGKGTVGYHLKGLKTRKNINALNDDLKKEIIEYYIKCKNFSDTFNNFKYLSLSKYNIKNFLIENKIYLHNGKFNINKNSKSQNVINWKRKKKLELIEYKGGKCVICGYNKCASALEFHHRDPNQKDFGIGNSSFSFKKMKIEVDKCDLVCSNCHREIHYNSKN